MAADGKTIVKRYHDLKDEAGTFRVRWELMAPYLALSRVGIVTKYAPGQKLNPYVFDSTSLMAAELLAQFIWGHIANPAQLWGSMRMRNPTLRDDDAINEWLEDSRDRMLAAFARSMFYAEGVETCIDWSGFGTGFLTIEEVPQAVQRTAKGFRGFHVQAKKTGRFCIADGPDGLVNTAYDEIDMTATMMEQRWGKAVLPENVQLALKSSDHRKKFTIIHAVYPRPESEQRYAAGAKKMPFASVWVEQASATIIVESGYPSFNAAVPRYQRTPEETYGRGRGDIAFADIWTLNQAKKMGLEDWALKIRPPVLVRHDSVIGTLRLVPAGPTSVNTHGGSIRDALMPFETGSHPEVSQLKEEDLRKSIRQVFFIDQILNLMEVSKSEMTAFEFAKKLELLFKLLGPVYGRAEHELLRPVWDIAFETMLHGGAFAPPPDSIYETDGEIETVFENPLSRAQRATDMEAVGLAIQDLTPMASIYPEVFDWFDPDKTAKLSMSVRGVPAKITRNAEEVQAFRDERFKQQQGQQQMAQATQIAEAAGKAAPMLSALQGGNAR